MLYTAVQFLCINANIDTLSVLSRDTNSTKTCFVCVERTKRPSYNSSVSRVRKLSLTLYTLTYCLYCAEVFIRNETSSNEQHRQSPMCVEHIGFFRRGLINPVLEYAITWSLPCNLVCNCMAKPYSSHSLGHTKVETTFVTFVRYNLRK